MFECSFHFRTLQKDASSHHTVSGAAPPPQALKVERAVLAALLSEKRAIVEVIDLLNASLFYLPKHQHIYAAIYALARDEVPVDILTVTEQLKKDKKLKDIGGSAYLAELSMQVSSSVHVETHVRLLMEYSIRRELIMLALKMRQDAHQGEEDALDMLDSYEQQFFAISQQLFTGAYTPISKVFDGIMARIHEVKDNKSGLTGVPSGFLPLDRLTGGWQAGDLIVVAARPSMGKTALAINMFRNAALDFDYPVAFFSLEMSAEQLTQRLIATEAGISSEGLRRGALSNEELEKLAGDNVQRLLHLPMYIDDTAALSVMELRAKARQLCARNKIKLIIVDYLQLMRAERNRQDKYGNREQEIASISRMLKGLAKELHIPVIAISQLSRAVEQRMDKRPMLSDLRESGAIEQDADMVLFLYRPEYYGITEDENGNSTRGHTEVIVSKHRNGAVGDFRLHFDAVHTRFTDTDTEEYRTLPSKMNVPNEKDTPF